MKNIVIAGGLVAALSIPGAFFLRVDRPHIVLPAEGLFHVAGFVITNTMLSAWVTLLVLTVVFLLAIRKRDLVPSGMQAWVEGYTEAMLSLVEGVAGKAWGRRFFPLVATIFLFVITNNWLGLLPWVGPSVYISEEVVKEGHAEILHLPLFRNPNSDLNTTLGLALLAMIMVQYWGIRANGLPRYIGKFVNVHGPINFFVGILELISEVARAIAFTFRLFGNMFAGEVLLLIMTSLISVLFFMQIFYALEVFVGFVQALIFAMLTLVFATMAVAGHGEGEEHKEH